MVVVVQEPPQRKKTSVQLWKHQRPVYVAIGKALYKHARALVVAPPGFGKTVVTAFVARDYFKRPTMRILYLAHENEILQQAELRYEEVIGGAVVYDRFYGNYPAPHWNSKRKGVLFSSFQTMTSGDEIPAYLEYDPDHFDLLIVDEGHHAYADTWTPVVEYFNCPRLAITAVKEREDGKDISDLFGRSIVDIDITDGIAEGWLAGIEYYSMNDGLDKEKLKEICEGVLEKNQRTSINELNRKLFIERRIQTQVEIIGEVARIKEKSMDLKTMIFCKNIAHAKQVYKCFKEGTAGIVHSKLTDKRNSETIQQFRDGDIQYILSVDKMNEGIDVPDVQAIVFLRDTDSYRIFIQQLGRGLRKLYWKTVVRVIDFVGNIDRLMMINRFANEVREKSEKFHKRKRGPRKSSNDIIISGEGFDFNFDAELVDVMKVLRAVKQGFYETWQEASQSVINLGIKTSNEYKERYKEDIRLMCSPWKVFKDFPGWPIFTGTERNDLRRKLYSTWQEASKAAIELGIKNAKDYRARYKEDSMLPAYPVEYKDFPGWIVFLGNKKKEIYSTWQEATQVLVSLGIKSQGQYFKRYREDLKLPSDPYDFYKDFPGWNVFLGKEKKEFYLTWQEASDAALKLGIKSISNYKKYYKQDVRLPGAPQTVYKDFPGWIVFLGKEKKEFYLTWQEASDAALKLGIKTSQQYRGRYKEDPKLPGALYGVYKDFPGMSLFLGKTK